MHSLTTRAQADHYRRQRLVQLPPRPPRFVPAQERPAYRLATGLLRLVVAALALLVLATALYPAGQPSRPLRLTEEAPARGLARSIWYESDYAN